MELAQLKGRIKENKLAGAYALVGEEEYLKRYYLGEIRRCASPDEALGALNHAVFDGVTPTRAAVAEAIESPPMMSEYKLVEWRYPSIGTGRSEISLQAICELGELARSTGYTVFAILISDPDFELGTQKKPSKVYTTLSKSFDTLRFDKSTDTQLMSWLKKHFDANGVGVGRVALEEMLSFVGHSMDELAHEVDKLSYLVKARGESEVLPVHVREVCSSNIECDAFALRSALSERNKKLAFTALRDLDNKKTEPVAVINSLAAFYGEMLSVSAFLDDGMDAGEIERVMKMHPFRLKMCIASVKKYGSAHIASAARRLAELDARSKSGGLSGYGAIEMFIAEYI